MNRDGGAALIIALLAVLLLMALGLSLVLGTGTETMIAGHFQTSVEAFYAADGGLELVAGDLARSTDWNGVLRGGVQSIFTDGFPSGGRILADGSALDLEAATNLLNCGHRSLCSPAEMDASTVDRPWGSNNPRWSLFAHGPASAMAASTTINSNLYVAVWVADDPSENDGDSITDGDDPDNRGSGVMTLRAEAFGAGGAHAVLEATIARKDRTRPEAGVGLVSWKEVN